VTQRREVVRGRAVRESGTLSLLHRAGAHLEEVLAAAAFATVVVAVSANVFMRYVLHGDLAGASEIATTLYFWAVMLGVGAAARRRMHPTIDFFVSALPARFGAAAAILVQALLVYFLADFTLSSLHFAWVSGFNKFTGVLKLPFFYTYLALPVGLGIMLVRTMVNLVADVRAAVRKEPSAPARSDASAPPTLPGVV
jgi:TRAP-type transport system small permease protein